MRGRKVAVSIPRRLMIDLLHVARRAPVTVAQVRMSLAPLIAARASAQAHVSWSAIFARAYGLAAVEMPELRRFYTTFPWPHFYQLEVSVGQIAVERFIDGEPAVLGILIKDPAARQLPEISRFLADAMAAPVDAVTDFQRAIGIARLPLPVRRLVWWIGMTFGRQRANYLGTFAISSIAHLGADLALTWSPCPVLLSYATAGDTGEVDVRLMFDHRCFDGATAARVLSKLEDLLLGRIVDELGRVPAPDAAGE